MAEAFAGEVRLKNLDTSGEPSLVVGRRSAVKLGTGGPTIAVCMPVGPKDISEVGECPQCKVQISTQVRRAQGMVPLAWATNHMQLVAPLNASMVYMFEFGRLAAEAREVLTHEALRRGAKYIFYWDDDTLIPPLAIYEMHQYLETHPDVGAVTGVYTTRETRSEPVLYKEHGQGAYWGFEAGEFSTPEEVFSTGGGCLMVRTDAIRKMEPPYWADGYEHNVEENGEEHRIVWGHDVRFCIKIRQEADMALHVMGSILCGHYDADTGITFTLPANSPPMRRWRVQMEQNYWADVWGNGSKVPFGPKAVYDWAAEQIPFGCATADLGCGSGEFVQRVTMERDGYAMGYDCSDAALAFARQLYLPVMELDLRNIKDSDIAGADVVTLLYTMEWLSDAVRDRVLEKCKGKRVIIATDTKIENNNRLTKATLKKLLAKHFTNFDIQKIGTTLVAVGDDSGIDRTGSSEPNLSAGVVAEGDNPGDGPSTGRSAEGTGSP